VGASLDEVPEGTCSLTSERSIDVAKGIAGGRPGGSLREARAPAGRAGSFTIRGRTSEGPLDSRSRARSAAVEDPAEPGREQGASPMPARKLEGGWPPGNRGRRGSGRESPREDETQEGIALRDALNQRCGGRTPGTRSLGDEAADRATMARSRAPDVALPAAAQRRGGDGPSEEGTGGPGGSSP